jgi:N-acetylneuraminate synthase
MGIFFTAEIGINHNGQVDIAKQMIDLAVDVGCDAVKFQKRTVESVYTKAFLDAPRESPWGATQRDQKTGLELGREEYAEIDRYCREKGIAWYASAWDCESQAFLRQFDLAYNKIASAMLVHEELLRMVASEKRHTFVSTGMSTVEDIDRAVAIFREAACPFELMHCMSVYPMQDEDANLNCIEALRKRYGCNVGYSGHEVGLVVSFAAAALGITSLERHITLSRAMYGSDQALSLEPSGLRMLVGGIRKIERAMGDGVLGLREKEVGAKDKLRSHIPFTASRREHFGR